MIKWKYTYTNHRNSQLSYIATRLLADKHINRVGENFQFV